MLISTGGSYSRGISYDVYIEGSLPSTWKVKTIPMLSGIFTHQYLNPGNILVMLPLWHVNARQLVIAFATFYNYGNRSFGARLVSENFCHDGVDLQWRKISVYGLCEGNFHVVASVPTDAFHRYGLVYINVSVTDVMYSTKQTNPFFYFYI